MPVLISSKVKEQTQEGYDAVLLAVRDALKNAPGFIMHCAYPAEGEWQLYEIWDSKAAADQWFAKYVVPNIPKGLHPKRSYQELYSLLGSFEMTV